MAACQPIKALVRTESGVDGDHSPEDDRGFIEHPRPFKQVRKAEQRWLAFIALRRQHLDQSGRMTQRRRKILILHSEVCLQRE
jgi:hypothetical protein